MARGRVVIVGAGPGDPDLITVKGLNYLKKADVVVYDRLVPLELLSKVKSGAELIYVGKEPGRHIYTQDEINNLLYVKALEGGLVVRLKGGDPYNFGRGEEECIFLLERGVECIVVPGIPSYVGASVYSGIPLTSRGVSSSFAVITGREAEGKKRRINIEGIAAVVDTLVILMGVSSLPDILGRVSKVVGWNRPAAVVMNATTRSQHTIVGDLKVLMNAWFEGRISNPAVIFVGEVVRLRDRLWRFE